LKTEVFFHTPHVEGIFMAFKAAFVFVAPEVDSSKSRSTIQTPQVELITVGTGSYADAEQIVVELLAEGVVAFELCAGFGDEGVARIKKIIAGRAQVGVVRFDAHPGFDFKSGDELFQ
jgi:hypothetical protein